MKSLVSSFQPFVHRMLALFHTFTSSLSLSLPPSVAFSNSPLDVHFYFDAMPCMRDDWGRCRRFNGRCTFGQRRVTSRATFSEREITDFKKKNLHCFQILLLSMSLCFRKSCLYLKNKEYNLKKYYTNYFPIRW